MGSPNKNKPRVFDLLIEDDGKTYLEVKLKRTCEKILLTDVFLQIPQDLKNKMNYRAWFVRRNTYAGVITQTRLGESIDSGVFYLLNTPKNFFGFGI